MKSPVKLINILSTLISMGLIGSIVILANSESNFNKNTKKLVRHPHNNISIGQTLVAALFKI